MLLPAAVDDRAALQFLKTLSASSHADLEFLRGHSGARGGLIAVEQSLVENVGCGEWLDLAGDESAMKSWGDSRTCRASVIRDILRGRLAPDPDPHGLRLRGARISGRLDLEYLKT